MLDTEDFLAHYGVRGMRWGVRKKRVKDSADDTTLSEKEKATQKIRKDHRDRNVKLVLAATTAVGALTVAYMLHKGGGRRTVTPKPGIKLGPDPFKESRTFVESIIKKNATQPVPKVPIKVKVNAKSYSKDLADLKKAAAYTVEKANEQLRLKDNELNIPFSQRSYLQEWT